MVHPLTICLRDELNRLRNPEKAPAMQAYMKTDQPFYGVQSGPRRKSFKAIAKRFKIDDRATYRQVIFELWHGEYREEMYMALEVVEHYKTLRDIQSWPIYEALVFTATNWDTLDWIATKLVSPLVFHHREFEDELVRWSKSDNFWVRRASILAHLHHKDETNTRLLGDTILSLSHEKEFFIRKAIGWVLRDYARTNPEWVRQFVTKHQDVLSGLSKREALKHL